MLLSDVKLFPVPSREMPSFVITASVEAIMMAAQRNDVFFCYILLCFA